VLRKYAGHAALSTVILRLDRRIGRGKSIPPRIEGRQRSSAFAEDDGVGAERACGLAMDIVSVGRRGSSAARSTYALGRVKQAAGAVVQSVLESGAAPAPARIAQGLSGLEQNMNILGAALNKKIDRPCRFR
jgi:hypothetical protein